MRVAAIRAIGGLAQPGVEPWAQQLLLSDAPNEVRANAAAPLGADGFVPPSLMGLHAFPQTFFHNGSAETLEQVMSNTQHRSLGTPGGVDKLTDASKRAQLIRFILSIDQFTPPIEPQ